MGEVSFLSDTEDNAEVDGIHAVG